MPSRYSETTDPSMLESIKDWRDDDGWRRFHEKYGPLIIQYAVTCGLNPGEASEVLQDTLVKVSRYVPHFEYDRDRCRFRVWLNTVVNHRIAEAMRRRRSQVRESMMLQSLAMEVEGIPEADESMETRFSSHLVLLEMVVNQVRQEIAPARWQLFEAKFLHGLTTREIAERFQISQVNVRVIQSRVLTRLREAWLELGGSPIKSDPSASK